ncbi:MAG: iron-sulfur cluster repair di-iron protein [Bacteroidales bacterium]|nr:iron-sulfur cluster repair di-iron protein [Bacteroidales bacterium]
MKNLENKTVGEIVAENIAYAQVFQSYGIDFCCGGDILLSEAVKKANTSLDDVIKALESEQDEQSLPQALNFNAWSLDLLIDYVNKFHHRYIRTKGPQIYSLLEKVVNAHGETDPHLYQVLDLFGASLFDLHNHLDKEEQILFPLVAEMLKALDKGERLPMFHCGSVQNPIRVMNQEHDDEGARFRVISELTNSYTAPEHACNSYKLVLEELKQFEKNLHIHIHVENNIIFPKAIKLEDSFN